MCATTHWYLVYFQSKFKFYPRNSVYSFLRKQIIGNCANKMSGKAGILAFVLFSLFCRGTVNVQLEDGPPKLYRCEN